MWKVVCPLCGERIYLEDNYFKTRTSPIVVCPNCEFPIRVNQEEVVGNRVAVNRFGRKVA